MQSTFVLFYEKPSLQRGHFEAQQRIASLLHGGGSSPGASLAQPHPQPGVSSCPVISESNRNLPNGEALGNLLWCSCSAYNLCSRQARVFSSAVTSSA